MGYAELLKTTNAYSVMAADKRRGTLAHAYLIVCSDVKMLRSYLTAFAKLIMCGSEEYCDNCRICRLIDNNKLFDCTFYPKADGKFNAEAASILVNEEVYVKPLEGNKRLFVITDADTVNDTCQNKILKTLEEPPENVCFILGAKSVYGLLPTVLSRVKRLEIPPFASCEVVEKLSDIFPDRTKLNAAASAAEGLVGEISDIYYGKCEDMRQDAFSILDSLEASGDVLPISARYGKLKKESMLSLFNALRLVLRDLLVYSTRGEQGLYSIDGLEKIERLSLKYKRGALLAISAKLTKCVAQADNNANQTMLFESLLFNILEENYRWQKL